MSMEMLVRTFLYVNNVKLVYAILHTMMKANDIPVEKIQAGIDLSLRQTEMLVTSSKLLFDAKKYPISLALSILTIEEAAKTKLLLKWREKGENVPLREWESFSKGKGAHRKKLGYDYESAKERFRTDITPEMYYEKLVPTLVELSPEKDRVPSYEQMQLWKQEDIDQLQILDRIKQDCLYTFWDGTSWLNFMQKVNKKQQAAVALVELYRGTYHYWSNYRWNKFPVIYAPGTPESNTFMKDISNQEIEKLGKILVTAKYKREAQSWRWVLNEYLNSFKQ